MPVDEIESVRAVSVRLGHGTGCNVKNFSAISCTSAQQAVLIGAIPLSAFSRCVVTYRSNALLLRHIGSRPIKIATVLRVPDFFAIIRNPLYVRHGN
jgi:hypothetical protein